MTDILKDDPANCTVTTDKLNLRYQTRMCNMQDNTQVRKTLHSRKLEYHDKCYAVEFVKHIIRAVALTAASREKA
jgi:hypothetical protein